MIKFKMENENFMLDIAGEKLNFNTADEYKKIVEKITDPNIKKNGVDLVWLDSNKDDKRVSLILEYFNEIFKVEEESIK